jgi:hypothetical protein
MAEGHNPIYLVLGTWELPKRATPVLARRFTNCFIFIYPYLSIICKFSAIFISLRLFHRCSPLPAPSRSSLRLLSREFGPKALLIGSQDLDVVEVS